MTIESGWIVWEWNAGGLCCEVWMVMSVMVCGDVMFKVSDIETYFLNINNYHSTHKPDADGEWYIIFTQWYDSGGTQLKHRVNWYDSGLRSTQLIYFINWHDSGLRDTSYQYWSPCLCYPLTIWWYTLPPGHSSSLAMLIMETDSSQISTKSHNCMRMLQW